ncbi:hypothetical protein ACQR2B_24895, partial [Bradyrhizobium oligotrophicum]
LRFMLWSSLGQNELQTGLSPRGKVSPADRRFNRSEDRAVLAQALRSLVERILLRRAASAAQSSPLHEEQGTVPDNVTPGQRKHAAKLPEPFGDSCRGDEQPP